MDARGQRFKVEFRMMGLWIYFLALFSCTYYTYILLSKIYLYPTTHELDLDDYIFL